MNARPIVIDMLKEFNISLPVSVISPGPYYEIVDKDGALVCFMGMNEQARKRAEFIADLINNTGNTGEVEL